MRNAPDPSLGANRGRVQGLDAAGRGALELYLSGCGLRGWQRPARFNPTDGLRALAKFTYDHHTGHRDFIRLVNIEKIHRAEHIEKSAVIHDLNSTAIETLDDVLHRVIATGQFRTDIDALDLHAMISSYCLFPVANRYTFRTLFGRDMRDPARHDSYRHLIGDMIVATMSDRSRPEPTGPVGILIQVSTEWNSLPLVSAAQHTELFTCHRC